MQRRQFLAAAAALAALPQAATADTGRAEGIVEDRSVTDDGTYSITDCGSVPGGLNNVHVTADMNDGPLNVEGVHEEDGKTFHEYEVGGVSYPSAEVLEAALDAR
jgi:hypothetical protein